MLCADVHRFLYGAKFEKNVNFFGKNFPFFFKLVNCDGDFWPNWDQSVQYYDEEAKFYSLETQV